jgi:hypothetical protein
MTTFTVDSSPFTVHRCRQYSRLLITVNCLLLTFFSACIPARTPEHLANTPGAPVVITDEEYLGAAFRVRYPAGWRVINGSSQFPQTVTFAAPGNCLVITLSSAPLDTPTLPSECSPVQTDAQQFTQDSLTIYAVGAASEADWAGFRAEFERALASVETSTQNTG